MNRKQQYLNLLSEVDLNDNSTFQGLFIEGLDILNLSDLDASKLIDVSVPSIKRWKQGQIPHLVFRHFAFKQIIQKIMEDLHGTD